MALDNIENRYIDAIDSLMNEVEVAEVIEINGDLYDGTKSHLNFI